MFNLRVYGILINDQQQVLLEDTIIRGSYITKFPGGGLEFGEGTRDCLKREFSEEMNLEVTVTDHIYTTDYFQVSAFNPSHQVISIYYLVSPNEPIKARLKNIPFDFDDTQMKIYEATGETETFRFVDWKDFSPELLTLPIDKIVASKIIETARLKSKH